MHLDLLPLLECPLDRRSLDLLEATIVGDKVIEGQLRCPTPHTFAIREGVPRFVDDTRTLRSVGSFGDEWNFFNFVDFKANWLNHLVRNTFGSPHVFREKVIVDCGAGSGAQSLWMSEAGAARVIALELSHAVDGVMRNNLAPAAEKVDVIQCDIAHPPFKADSIGDIVICHNVIQHTESVENTAIALYRIVKPGGELVFNCYMKDGSDPLRTLRRCLYAIVRAILSRSPHPVRLAYAWTMSRLIVVPLLGRLLILSKLAVCGDVPVGPHRRRRRIKQTFLNTYDLYGSHRYQHYKTPAELLELVRRLQPDLSRVMNLDAHLSRRSPPGAAFRIPK